MQEMSAVHCSETISTASTPETQSAIDAAHAFVSCARDIDRALRQAAATIPRATHKELLAARFWALVSALEACDRQLPAIEAQVAASTCRDLVSGWLNRSRYFNRSIAKPHGYAGDFRMLEWMYDLEADACEDPTQPGIVNCLDHVFASVHSVQSVWERRRWFTELLRREHASRGGKLRILDIACGGARYTRDFLSGLADVSGVSITLLDQDAAALAFCRISSLEPWANRLECISKQVKDLSLAVPSGTFDVTISTGLFDYLPAAQAKQLIAQMTALTADDGVVAISNFAPEDPSRLVKDWLVGWPLIYRSEREVAALFSPQVSVATTRSANLALVYGVASRSAVVR